MSFSSSTLELVFLLRKVSSDKGVLKTDCCINSTLSLVQIKVDQALFLDLELLALTILLAPLVLTLTSSLPTLLTSLLKSCASCPAVLSHVKPGPLTTSPSAWLSNAPSTLHPMWSSPAMATKELVTSALMPSTPRTSLTTLI